MFKHLSLITGLAVVSVSSMNATDLICDNYPSTHTYCKTLKSYYYPKTEDLDNILYMTDKLSYLGLSRKADRSERKIAKSLEDKIFDVMKDINKLIQIAANEVRKEKYKALGMVVIPVKYGSSDKLKYRETDRDMKKDRLPQQIDKFYTEYDTHNKEFLTDVLKVNSAMFLILPEIVQLDEILGHLREDKEADFQISIDGYFGIEKGLTLSIVELALKLDGSNQVRRVFDRKTEYAKIKQALIELVDKALGDIASQDEG